MDFIVGVAFVVALYLFFNRLYFCPVAAFPGPRLAALTFWYEFYYDVVCKGRYTWKIQQLHEKYGPIIRINPSELHINDPHFYDELYVGPSRRTEKWHWSAKMFGTKLAAVGTTGHELHRVRRSALNPFFSKMAVTRLEPVIQANVNQLRMRLQEAASTGKPVNLVDAFTCLSADVIGSFAFGRSYGFLDTDDFNPGWHKLMMDLSRSSHLMKQFGWLYGLLTMIPETLVSIVHPLTKKLFKLQSGIAAQIRQIESQKRQNQERGSSHQTIFHDLLSSNLPPPEKSLPRLAEEGLTLVGAGTVTTAYTLSTISYHLLANPTALIRLRAELSTLRPGRSNWQHLEQLPYLGAVISEGLRLSYGVSHRLQRISPDMPLHFRGWTIPPGTPVSMTQMFIHLDPNIFSDPDSFIPERWLQSEQETSNRSTDSSHPRHFLVPFSRGTRQCVGMNLAYAEIYLTIAALFRAPPEGGVDMRLYHTDRSDVDVVHDFFNPSPRLDSKGIRVLVERGR